MAVDAARASFSLDRRWHSCPRHSHDTQPASSVESVNRKPSHWSISARRLGEELKNLGETPHHNSIRTIARQNHCRVEDKGHETGHPYDAEARLRRADGVYRWFHTHGFPLRDTDGRIVLWYLLQTDVDDRKRSEALLAGEKQLLEMVAGGHSMSEILEAICRLVESTAGGCYCSVLLTDPSGTRVEHGAAPSLPASFIASINGRPVNVDSGPCAMAAYLNEQVIATDLTSETRWKAYAWCPMALAHGLQACWSTPISSAAGKVLGAFAIYYKEPKTPTPQQGPY